MAAETQETVEVVVKDNEIEVVVKDNEINKTTLIETTENIEAEVSDKVEKEEEKEEEEYIPETDTPVDDAMSENARLKAELEALNTMGDVNVMEENDRLKKELEEKQKAAEIYKENEALKSSLVRIKREQLTEGMVLGGKLPKELLPWAETLSIEQLTEYNKFQKARRTIKDEKNSLSHVDASMQEWHQKESRSRIIT